MTQRERTELVPAPHGRTLAAPEHRSLIARGLADIEPSDADDLFELGLEGFRLLIAIFGQDTVDPDWTAARRAAAQGHADAQYWLGIVYSNGLGVSADASEAAKWYHRAAERGHAKAGFELGHMYAVGRGVPQNSREADKWYRRAAEQGHTEAKSFLGLGAEQQFLLGVMYDTARGVPQDHGEAARWYRRAAEQGHASSFTG